MKTTFKDFVIYLNGRAYSDYESLKAVIGQNNANKAFYRALEQKEDVTSWKLRKCGKYEIHLK